MKILFITPRFYPSIGGVEKHVLEISKELVSRGHEVSVITENFPKGKYNKRASYQSIGQSDTQGINLEQPVKSSYFETKIVENLKVYYFNFGKAGWFKKFKIWARLLSIVSVIKGPDIIHCHDVFFWYLPFRFLLPNKKVFTTFHGYESYPIKTKATIVRKISELLSYGSICIGDFMKKWYGANPNYVVYGGVNRSESKVVRKPSAFFFGRLDEQTNIVGYCRAVDKIREYDSDFGFLVVGEGKYSKFAQKYGKLTGFVEHPDKELQSHRFAFVSRYLSILEALAAKKMVFALYDNPLKRDYLEMTPFRKYINIVNNPSDLASKVHFYYSNPKVEQEMISAGHEWVKSQTWKKVVQTYLRLWRK